MDNNLQEVKASDLLSSLVNLLFKGLDRALSDAAEYEQEMGVLKQKNKLTITDKNGNSFEFYIKLSPVKNNDSLYYVEVDANGVPNLDVSSLDKKAVKLDKKNIDKFRKIVKDLVAKSGYTYEYESSSADTSEESTEEAEADADGTVDEEVEAEATDIIDDVIDRLEHNIVLGNIEGKGLIAVNREVEITDDVASFDLIIYGTAAMGDKRDIGLKEEVTTISLLHDGGEFRTFADIWQDVTNATEKYIKENKITDKQYMQASTNVIHIIVNKDSATGNVSLRSINASTDILAGKEIVDDILEDQDFIDSIEDDTDIAFSIEDLGDSYDIEVVEDYNSIEATYQSLFEACSRFKTKLETFRWAIGDQGFWLDASISSCWTLINEIVDEIAVWNISQLHKYPVIVPWADSFQLLVDAKDESGNITTDSIKPIVSAELNQLIEALKLYAISLAESEQAYIDLKINELNKIALYI